MGIFKKRTANEIIDAKKDYEEFIDSVLDTKTTQLSVKNKAIGKAIDIIASTISKCELKVYKYDTVTKKIISIKDSNYYKLNVRPNKNEHGSEFFYRAIYKLLEEEELLIVELNSNLYIANNWITNKNILSEKTYSNVELIDEEGNLFNLYKTFTSKEVIHIVLKDKKINTLLDSFYSDFGKLINVAQNKFLNKNAQKFRISHPGNQLTMIDPKTNKPISYEEYKSKLVDGLFGPEDKVLLLSNVFSIEDLNSGYNVNSDNYEKLLQKWSDEVATSFNIPLDIFNGNKTDKSTSTNDFITFSILPIMQFLEDAINATLFSPEEISKGYGVKYNRWNIKHSDILDAATSIDKLFSDGFSHNEICDFLSLPILDEEWANKHYITKNYADANDIAKGGDENE